MAHVHFHGEESVRNYFTEQLLTILVCALFAFAAIQMYRTTPPTGSKGLIDVSTKGK